jgi:hypothetical protein
MVDMNGIVPGVATAPGRGVQPERPDSASRSSRPLHEGLGDIRDIANVRRSRNPLTLR